MEKIVSAFENLELNCMIKIYLENDTKKVVRKEKPTIHILNQRQMVERSEKFSNPPIHILNQRKMVERSEKFSHPPKHLQQM